MTYHKTTAFWPRAAPGFQVFPSFSEKFQIQTQCGCVWGGAAKKTTPCLGGRQKQRHVDSSPPAAHLLGTIPPSVPHLRGKKSKIHLGKHAALCPKCFLWVSRCPPASPPCHLVSAASSLLTPLLSEPKLSWGPTPPWCHIQPPPSTGSSSAQHPASELGIPGGRNLGSPPPCSELQRRRAEWKWRISGWKTASNLF